MEETEEVTTVRKTRSGRAVRPPPKPKASPKPATRKTKKKVVLMEVEVTDDEETSEVESKEKNHESDAEEAIEDKKPEKGRTKKFKKALPEKDEESLLASEDESQNSIKNGNKATEESEDIQDKSNDSEESIVLNDITMLEEILHTNEKIAEKAEQDRQAEENTASQIAKITENENITFNVEEVIEEKEVEEQEVEIIKGNVVIEETTEVKEITPEGKVPEVPSFEENVSSEEVVKEPVAKKEEKIVKEEKEIVKKIVSEEVEEVTEEKEVKKVTEEKEVEQVTEEKVVEKVTEEKVIEKVTEEKAVEKVTEEKVVQKVTEEKVVEKVTSEEVPAETTENFEDTDVDMPLTEKKDETKKELTVVVEKLKDTCSKKQESDEESLSEKKEPTVTPMEGVEEEPLKKKVEKEIVNGIEEVSSDADNSSEDNEKGPQNGDPDAENISEDELPGVPVAKVPEAEEVSDEELPGPKRAELPADTEVVSEDELPTAKKEDELPAAKKEGTKRKLSEGDYDPTSPTSENEAPSKKVALEVKEDKEKDEKPAKPKKLPELDKYWKAVNDDPSDFTGWTYLLQYVDQENDMEAAREAYDAFLSHYPYCYGYWRKYADYEKRKGNKKKCEEVFERGLKAIPLSVDLWIHYLTYVKQSKPEDEEYIRSQFERALTACGLEFRSDRLWDSYIKWETEAKRFQKVTALYDRLLATPTQGYTTHFDNFQEHISTNPPNKVVEVDEFLALRKEVRHMLKHDVTTENAADNADVPPGDEDSKLISSDEETKCIRERIVSIRRKIHKNTVNAVTARWNYEEGIKRPYFHVKPLERCQLKNWQDYLDYEIEQADRVRIVVLFERCLIACALYEEFWLKFVHYLESLNDAELQTKIRDVYERACTIHHLKKPNLHLQWAMFEESSDNCNRAAEILVNLEKSVPNVLQVAYRRINLERRRGDHEKCSQLFEHYINNSKNKMISSNIAIKYSRFCLKVLKDMDKAQEVLKMAITKDPNNPRLFLQLIDLTLQKEGVTEEEICALIDEFLDKETADVDQKVLFAQRKLEYLEDFGASIKSVQTALEQYQKCIKSSKDNVKKKETKSESSSSSKKEKSAAPSSTQSSSYGNYNYQNSSQPSSYPGYTGSQQQQGQYNYSAGYGQGDQYQYQNWQYPQGGYGGYNQWGGYGGGYGY